MFSQLAQVFSSQGVVLQGTERIPVYRKQAEAEAPCEHKDGCSCFAPKFEQASAKLELSKQAKSRMDAEKTARESQGGSAAAEEGGAEAEAAGAKSADGKPLSDEEQKQVEELEKRDREVKAHEAAHKASAGGNARGGASYEYQAGPDGRQYAVGGHVDIDVGPVQGNPRATLQKAQTVQRAALAPADPSGQDRAVAAAAAQLARQAQSEVAQASVQGGSEGRTGAPGSDPRRAYGQQAPRKGASVSVYA
jgi:hypothetical protein